METRYFKEDGSIIEWQENFIKYYQKLYYNGSTFVRANNCLAEKRILDLLMKEDDFTEDDIFLIMAWKTGKIKNGNCKNDIVHFATGCDLTRKILKTYSYCLNIVEITKDINSLRAKKASIREYIEVLKKHKGIGNVYSITLGYMASKGKYPIYDQYAYRGIQAILMGGISNEVLNMKIKAPDVSNLSTGRMMRVYEEYVVLLKQVFGKNFNKREVDQALWVYGHLFK